MGNHRFRLADIMPNAWFYKLKDMSVIKRNQCRAPKPFPQQPPQASNHEVMFTPTRASYYLSSKRRDEETTLPSSPIHPKGSDTHFPLLVDPPRKSKRKPRRKTSTVIKPSTNLLTSSISTTCSCRANSPAKSSAAALQEFDLAPCSTKPAARERTSSIKPRLQEKYCSRSPRPSRLKLHVMNSPRVRVMSRKSSAIQQQQQQQHPHRKSISQSFAIVKVSSNPQKDFRDSMVEMILENNIRTSNDLEDLLASYLTLNSVEYHDVIVKVFEKIWSLTVTVKEEAGFRSFNSTGKGKQASRIRKRCRYSEQPYIKSDDEDETGVMEHTSRQQVLCIPR